MKCSYTRFNIAVYDGGTETKLAETSRNQNEHQPRVQDQRGLVSMVRASIFHAAAAAWNQHQGP
jgi:hypothetical protein